MPSNQTKIIKERALNYLEQNYWTNGRDNDLIKDFIINFFNQYADQGNSSQNTEPDPKSNMNQNTIEPNSYQ